jgi:hypothetical protein
MTDPCVPTAKAEPLGADLPDGAWNVELKRSFVPVAAGPLPPDEVRTTFGRIADGQLWTVRSVAETSDTLVRHLGQQSFQLTVAPGPDLRLLWPHRFSLFWDAIDLTPSRGAPLGLEVLILQKLLTTGISETGLADQLYESLVKIDQTQTANTGKAIANFAAALGGQPGQVQRQAAARGGGRGRAVSRRGEAGQAGLRSGAAGRAWPGDGWARWERAALSDRGRCG